MISLLACFTLLSLAARVHFVDGALPCTSPLRTRYPQYFSHCPKCNYTQWTTWSVVIPVQIKNETSCDSNKAKKYEQTRTPLPGSVCEDAIQKNTIYKCKYERSMHGIKYIFYMFCWLIYMYLAGVPTLRQQAELFIRSLRLGANGDEPTDNPATKPTTQPTPQTTRPLTTRPPIWTTRPPRPTTRRLFRTSRLYPTTRPPIWTTRPPRPTTWPPIWTTRPSPQVTIPAGSDYCPSLTEQANNRICHNVCPRGM